jgi:hypothetical protein
MRFERFQSDLTAEQNTTIEHAYLSQKDKKDVVKTHYINGRFENVYLQREQLPHLPQLLDEAITYATQILESKQPLKVGFWFNEMQVGDVTSAHIHEEDDELLSGVYYLSVPKGSGDLILGENSKADKHLKITPKSGDFIFFSPSLLHAVEENKSLNMRLSIGLNFGLASN